MVTINANGPTDLEVVLTGAWDATAVRNLINDRRAQGDRPVYLLLGRAEMALLLEHLSNAFGNEAVQCTQDLYYMGLSVVEIKEKETLFRLAGKKHVSLADVFGRQSVNQSHRQIA